MTGTRTILNSTTNWGNGKGEKRLSNFPKKDITDNGGKMAHLRAFAGPKGRHQGVGPARVSASTTPDYHEKR